MFEALNAVDGDDGSCMRVCVSSSWSESGSVTGDSRASEDLSFIWLGTSVSTGPYCEVEPTSKSVDGFKPPNILIATRIKSKEKDRKKRGQLLGGNEKKKLYSADNYKYIPDHCHQLSLL